MASRKPQHWAPQGRSPAAPSPGRRWRFRMLESFIWLLSLSVIGLVSFAVWDAYANPNGHGALGRFGHSVRGVIDFVRPEPNPFGARKDLTLLLLGTDETNNLCDTVMLGLVNLETKRIALLSIPRDSLVNIPYRGRDKLTHVFPYGMEKRKSINDGMALVKDTLEETLGIPIDNTIRVDLAGFVRLVDILGGVDINVEKRMFYRDRSQNLVIDLQPGFQHLDGQKAMGYVRFRHDAQADLARVQRQREFLSAVLARFEERVKQNPLSGIATMGQMAGVLQKYTTTDLTPAQIRYLVELGRKVSPETIESGTAPGTPAMVGSLGSVYRLDDAKFQEMLAGFIGSLHEENSPGQLALVEVLNGCGTPGLAEDARDVLEHNGFRVVRTGNADRFDHIRSEVYCAPGAEEAARAVARALHLSDEAVRAESVSSGGTDVRVVLGKNFTTQGLPHIGLSASF